MKNKWMAVLLTSGLALTLVGCGQQSSPTNSASSSSLLASKSSTKISADNLTPQQMVSVVTTYAGNKFGNQWATTAKDAKKAGLSVDLYPSSNYKLADDGEGVAYNVKAADKSSQLVYTVKGDHVTIFQNASKTHAGKKLTTVSRSAMVKYINDNGQGNFVNQLSQNAQVNDKRSGNADESSSNSSSSRNGKYGNEGPVTVPADMRGTWYTEDGDASSVTFGKNTITIDGSSTKLFKQDVNFLSDDSQTTNQTVQNATQHWGSGAFVTVDGLHYLNIRGWTQTAGDGESFALTTENINGKNVQVLVSAHGAEFWADTVYYRTKDLAHQQANHKYDDLRYQDDEQ
ncbi:hypothetical protein [uncultured Limosilactobacillus sp.]|uniref:hypothetical protein n=1 Tax=uncultured Limosilactobacillus sp. TaxID=2837629 RepID=UPI0025CCC4F8|nr:hypothetical protein [uncultured Limosilactobacillus sp.]